MKIVATIFDLIAGGSGLDGILSTQIIGKLASGGNYELAFVLMGFLHPVAWTIAWLAVRSKRACSSALVDGDPARGR